MFRICVVPFFDTFFQSLFQIFSVYSYNRLWDFYTVYNFEIWFLISLCWMLFCIYLIYSFFLYQMAAVHSSILDQDFIVPKYCLKEVYEVKRQIDDVYMKIASIEQIAQDNYRHKNDMIVYLAHDLKTPLTSIIGYLHLLQDHQIMKKKEDRVYRDIIIEKLDRLETLRIELALVLNENHLDHVLMKPVCLNSLLRSLIVDFSPIIHKSNIKIKFYETKDCIVYADKEKLIRLFSNLIKNATYYSLEGHDIEIHIKKEIDKVEILMSNIAVNMNEDIICHLFEKFYRGEAARSTNTGGAGLGLAIAKDIVLQHNGTINANYRNDQFQMQVKLPLYRGKDHDE